MRTLVLAPIAALVVACQPQRADPKPAPSSAPKPQTIAPRLPEPTAEAPPSEPPLVPARRAIARGHQDGIEAARSFDQWRVPQSSAELLKLAGNNRGVAVWNGSTVELKVGEGSQAKMLLEFDANRECAVPSENPPWSPPAAYRKQSVQPVWWAFEGSPTAQHVGLRLDTHHATLWWWNEARDCMTGQPYSPALATGLSRTDDEGWGRGPLDYRWTESANVQSYKSTDDGTVVRERVRSVPGTRVTLDGMQWRVTSGTEVVEIKPRLPPSKIGCAEAQAHIASEGASTLVDLRVRYGEHDCFDMAMHAAKLVRLSPLGSTVLASKHDDRDHGAESYGKTIYDRTNTFGALQQGLRGSFEFMNGSGKCSVPTFEDEDIGQPEEGFCTDTETITFTTDWRATIAGDVVELGTARFDERAVTCGYCGN